MEIKKFKAGKIYKGKGMAIEVIKRTEKTVTFHFMENSSWDNDSENIYRKKVLKEEGSELINLGNYWSSPKIYATWEVEDGN